jgi:hypothetical protein
MSTALILKVLHTILCLGLNLVIARLGLDPKWRYLVIGLLVVNEIRGIAMVYAFGDAVWP